MPCITSILSAYILLTEAVTFKDLAEPLKVLKGSKESGELLKNIIQVIVKEKVGTHFCFGGLSFCWLSHPNLCFSYSRVPAGSGTIGIVMELHGLTSWMRRMSLTLSL